MKQICPIYKRYSIFLIIFLIFNNPLIAQWEIIQTPSNTLISNINNINSNEMWVIQQTGYPIFRTFDGGLTWDEINFPYPNTWFYPSLSVINSSTAWLTNYHSDNNDYTGVFKTTDGGVSWTKQITAPFSEENSWPDIVHFWDLNTGVVIGDAVSGTNRLEIYTTSDGGNTWNRVPNENIPESDDGEYGPVPDSYTVVENTIWFTTYSGNLYKSSNNGTSWTKHQVYENLSSHPPVIAFKTLNDGIIIDNGQTNAFVTSDGGNTWDPINYSDILPGGSSIKYYIDNFLYLSTNSLIPGINERNGLMISNDNGQTWQKHISFDSKQIGPIDISDNGEVFLGAFQGLIFKSDNINGINPYISSINFPEDHLIEIEFNDQIEELSAENTNNYSLETTSKIEIPIISAVLDDTKKNVLLTLSENLVVDQEYSISADSISDLNSFYIIPGNKYNNRTFTYGHTKVIDNIKQSIVLSPNPTSGKILILYNEFQKEITADIFSSSGIYISKIPIKNNNEIDISNYPKGIYILKIKSNDIYTVKKIIKK